MSETDFNKVLSEIRSKNTPSYEQGFNLVKEKLRNTIEILQELNKKLGNSSFHSDFKQGMSEISSMMSNPQNI